MLNALASMCLLEEAPDRIALKTSPLFNIQVNRVSEDLNRLRIPYKRVASTAKGLHFRTLVMRLRRCIVMFRPAPNFPGELRRCSTRCCASAHRGLACLNRSMGRFDLNFVVDAGR
jgi:hypothetical protein